jgi:hypothetical protein
MLTSVSPESDLLLAAQRASRALISGTLIGGWEIGVTMNEIPFAVDAAIVARPKVGSRYLSAGLARAAPSRLAAALPVDAISNVSSDESRPCANARASRAA